jgi:hypothetical protein
MLVLSVPLSGCVRVPISRSKDPIPESPVDLASFNPTTALRVIAGGSPDSELTTQSTFHVWNGDEPLQQGEETQLVGSGQKSRERRIYRAGSSNVDSMGYLATSRGFESPPIDPLGQTSVFDRPIYQR